MAAPVGSLVVRIGSDIRGLQRGFQKGVGVVKSLGVAASRAAKRISLITTVAAAAGVAIGVKLARDGLKSVDAMTKLGRSIGATQAEMVALNAAADLVGISQEKMQKNLGAFTKRLGEAMDGTGQAVDALKKLELTADELANMPLPEALALVAERTQMFATAAERAAIESDLFSRAGIGMLTTTDDLAGAIRRSTKDTQDFGVAISQVDAAKIESANDAMARIGLVIKGVSNQLAVRLAPFLEEVADLLTGAARESKGFGESIETGLRAGIELSVLFARSFRIAAIAALSTAVAVEQVAGQTKKGNQTLTRFIARVRAVGDATQAIELDRQFLAMDKAASGAGVSASGLQKTLLAMVDSEESLDIVEEKLKGIANAATAAKAAADFDFVGPLQLPPDLGDDPELEALKEKAAARLEIIRQSFLNEREVEQEAFAEKLALLREAGELKLLTLEEFNAQSEALEKQHQEKLTDIEEQEGKARAISEAQMMANRVAAVSGFLAQMTAQLASAAEDNFKLQKALSIASAVLSGIESVVHSYNFGARIGGPILGATFAAIAAGVQFARIAQISSQQFQRGSSGARAVAAGPSGGAPAPTGGGGGAGGGGAGAQSVNISLVGETFGRTQVRDLIEEINDAVADGARLRIV